MTGRRAGSRSWTLQVDPDDDVLAPASCACVLPVSAAIAASPLNPVPTCFCGVPAAARLSLLDCRQVTGSSERDHAAAASVIQAVGVQAMQEVFGLPHSGHPPAAAAGPPAARGRGPRAQQQPRARRALAFDVHLYTLPGCVQLLMDVQVREVAQCRPPLFTSPHPTHTA